jgi:DNA-binding SARP family transcriptional activator
MRIALLGQFSIQVDDGPPSSITNPRLQSLIAYLILYPSSPHTRQHLAFLLWPDSTEFQARANLRKLLLQLRQAIPDWAEVIRVEGQTLQWRDTPLTASDIAEFKRAVAADDLALAAGLYRGDLLPDCYDEWVMPEREQLSQLYAGVLERLIASLEARRDYKTATDYAYRLLSADPLNETTYQTLMRLHAIRGNPASAARVSAVRQHTRE